MTSGIDGQVLRGTGRLTAWANFVKIAHTVFALPFAVLGMVLASRVVPFDWRKVALAVIAFAAARFTAMGFNRIVDLKFDAANPRTATRELPAGRMSITEAWILVAATGIVFVICTALLNPLCLALSLPALFWITTYSLSKRFTPLCHLWLGVGMAIAPVGGYLALTGSWSTPWLMLVVLAAVVAFWGAGFDVIYSLQDEQFDQAHGLRSMTTWLGARRAITVARSFHMVAVAALALLAATTDLGWPFAAAVGIAAVLLLWEHRLVRVGDYSKLDAAFFTMNGIIAGVVMLGALASVAR